MLKQVIRGLSVFVILGIVLAAPVSGNVQAAACGGTFCVYLPLVQRGCGNTGQTYAQGLVTQQDVDNPVRPASNHAGKNFNLPGYAERTGPGFTPGLVDYGAGSEDSGGTPPQFATMFSPNRVQLSNKFYQFYDWNYAPSPSPGTRGPLLTHRPITGLGLATTLGEVLRAPTASRLINPGYNAMVMYADSHSLSLKYTREDSSATGYTVFIDKICTDATLLALYNSLDGGNRNIFHGVGTETYNLPYITINQPIGTALSTEVVVAILDTGIFEDPRSCRGWWLQYFQTVGCPLRNGSTINGLPELLP